jgi:outer membrane lipoprotein-sorting protein
MRRIAWLVVIAVGISVLISGCVQKDAGSVVKELDHVISRLDSYQGAGKMVLNTGQNPQSYQVEVWYKNPHYYRIALANESEDITQIVLRNDEGVFVLTPHLNKSFRFQSDWPEKQGQVYLYQSLVKSILDDKNRQFVKENDTYVFDVLANYQNPALARQKIWLDAKNYAPRRVEVSDTNGNVLVRVDFTQFAFGAKFEKDSFDMQRNMTSWQIQSLPTLASADGKTGGAAAAPADGTVQKQAAAGSNNPAPSNGQTAQNGSPSGGAANASAAQKPFGVIEPAYTPEGVKKQDMMDIKLGDEPGVLLRYSGKYNYTILERRPAEQTVSVLPADILDLGFTLGVLTGEDYRSLTWISDGVEFRLSTGDLPQDEMIRIAQAVQGAMGK